MNISNADRQVLAKSGNRCAYDGCRAGLTVRATEGDTPNFIGEIAHIKGKKAGSARHDPAQPREERESDANKICLCRIHARQIDVQPATHTVELLSAMKSKHEKWVEESLATEVSAVSFAELDVICKAISSKPLSHEEGFDLMGIRTKMARNDLSTKVDGLLSLGLAKAREVADFVDETSKLSPNFSDEVRAGFVNEYGRLIAEGRHGDDLFMGLQAFAIRGSPDLVTQAAGVAVLAYLFEKCEVFER